MPEGQEGPGKQLLTTSKQLSRTTPPEDYRTFVREEKIFNAGEKVDVNPVSPVN
jgi:hypothetical protein